MDVALDNHFILDAVAILFCVISVKRNQRQDSSENTVGVLGQRSVAFKLFVVTFQLSDFGTFYTVVPIRMRN
jgi:hypothetical protein